MNLLLDTHVWLWSQLEPERLSARASDAVTDPAGMLALSPVSVWETLLLAGRGRVDLAPDPWEVDPDGSRDQADAGAPPDPRGRAPKP